MMIGERKFVNPTVLIPPWNQSDGSDASSFAVSPNGSGKFNVDDVSVYLQNEALTALQRYLPSNDVVEADVEDEELDLPVDVYTCDNFRMFEFKVRTCARARSHDWTECPYAHPGEKARRRDPRRYHYAGVPCPDFRKGYCKKGDACEFAHGVFECWLHPARYRTQPCKDGVICTRRVCFFAHTPSQLRILTPGSTPTESYDGSPRRAKGLSFLSPAFSDSSSVESAPVSPMGNSLSRSLGSNPVNELVASLHQLRLNKVNSMPTSWGLQTGSTGFPSPRRSISMARTGFYSLPSTPTRSVNRAGFGYMDPWDRVFTEDEPIMERVESGRDLRVKMFEKLSKENPLDRVDPTRD